MEPGASHTLSACCTTELPRQPREVGFIDSKGLKKGTKSVLVILKLLSL